MNNRRPLRTLDLHVGFRPGLKVRRQNPPRLMDAMNQVHRFVVAYIE
jgi:hypothetical protein